MRRRFITQFLDCGSMRRSTEAGSHDMTYFISAFVVELLRKSLVNQLFNVI